MRWLSQALNGVPVSAKVTLAALLSTGTALSIAAAVHIATEISNFRPTLERHKERLAQVVAANISAAVAFDDVPAMQENLESFELIPHVHVAQVRSVDGGIVAQYASEQAEQNGIERQEQINSAFWITTPITVRGAEIGMLELLVGQDELQEKINSVVIIALLALIVSMVPAIATIRYLKPIILKPVSRLSRTMDRVAATQDYDARVNKSVNDEFGQLVDRFNTMLDEIQRRDKRLESAAAEMEAARDFAEAANMTKTKFIANMSHELRTPLNAIIGYTEMVIEDLEETGQDTQVSDLNRILVAARHLLGLINDVLDVAKIEAGKLEIHPVPTQLPLLIEEAVEAVRPTATRNDSTLSIDIAADVGPAYLDPTRFKQCLLNLLSNACKFTSAGDVSLRASIMRETRGDVLVIEVEDTGIGIAEDHCKQLFEPFVQIDGSMTRSQGGSGLGLAITRDLLQAMGGEISVSSTLGEGSCFTMSVPTRLDKVTVPEMALTRAEDTACHRATILVIEDSNDSALLLQRWLEPAGFHVVVAETGSEGIALARSLPAEFIFLDIDLPDMTGWTVLEQLTGGANPVSCAIVVLTVDEDRTRALGSGAAELITKPVQKSRLLDLISAHIEAAPVTVSLLMQEGREAALGRAISAAGHRIEKLSPKPHEWPTAALSRAEALVLDGSLVSSGTLSADDLGRFADQVPLVILWQPNDTVIAKVRQMPPDSFHLAQSQSEVLILLDHAKRREPA